MHDAQGQVITRFAPSPTGHLHIGGARTALFCWAFARRHGGRFLIRIEDTDQARSSEASARGILEDLAWLGIEWDEGPELSADKGARRIGGDPRRVGPFFQSQRLEIYNRVVEEMLERGSAYADFTPAERMDALRKAAAAKNETFRFHPLDSEILPLTEQRARMKGGVSHVIRLRAPETPVHVIDEVLGEVKFGPGEVDDFVLRKADGFPTYHFGVVVDDELMGVTHVLRGQEHLMNTPRHVVLQRVLGYRTPVYAHMPLIFNDQGAKMSKRERDQTARAAVKQAKLESSPVPGIDDAAWKLWVGDTKRQLETEQLEAVAERLGLALPEVSVDDFRRAGYLPGVICNFIAILGWNPGMKNADGTDLERFNMEFLARHFDLPRIGKSNARFDRKKLTSFNGDGLGLLPEVEFLEHWIMWCGRYAPAAAASLGTLGIERGRLLARAIKPRCKTWRESLKPAAFALTDDDAIAFDADAIKKHLLAAPGAKAGAAAPAGAAALSDGIAVLEGLGNALATYADWTPAALEAVIDRFAEEHAMGKGQVAQPLRVALTGTAVSPGLGDTLAILGPMSTRRRIERALEAARAMRASAR